MDDFEQLQLLGHGGYSSVYLVQFIDSTTRYALKRIAKSKIISEKHKTRLEVEKSILFELQSPFLCRGFRTFETSNEILLLQEFIDGRPLYECIWMFQDTGRFPEHMAKFFAAQLVLALRDLHAHQYIHRDFKSGNVLIDKKGFAKVIDFGLSKSTCMNDCRSGRTQSLCGTHYIMAPEVFSRNLYDFSCDWWSLGVIIYEMVAGCPPWEYQCPSDKTINEYFQQIELKAESLFERPERKDETVESNFSTDLKSLICSLLQINPCKRLGKDGAVEVMNHIWFSDINWSQLEAQENLLMVPYNYEKDFNAARVRSFQTLNEDRERLSSAESIDPEDDVKYFADF
ncbi:agc protein kinase [Plasmopara halstedii]|uniref:Agc protein kinase n=1 Tax=Plasmopara halstedii TaxID=4781 RepID=A0A0N7L484_PLAHL|nr:agc protein kinase [Plasmopara halstedii]CEG37963.1 agc protein kinase [Plasmopara halstedii]|eukprot:XP_024574332.1 agc protein kinase [Plasmopara halstedii]